MNYEISVMFHGYCVFMQNMSIVFERTYMCILDCMKMHQNVLTYNILKHCMNVLIGFYL